MLRNARSVVMRGRRGMAAAAGERSAFIVHAAGPQGEGMMMDHVTGAVAQHGGDILSSRATILGKDFSMMLVVKCPVEQNSAMEASLAGLAKNKITTCIHPATAPDVQYTLPHKHAVKVLRLTGHDTAGIVSAVTEYFAKQGVRVLNLASEMAAAPFTDDPMFKLRVVLDLPADMSEETLEEGIEAVAQLLGVDLWVESLN